MPRSTRACRWRTSSARRRSCTASSTGEVWAEIADAGRADATAAIDAATEQGIREALRTQTATRATIVIAHRLGSLMDADEIVFLERGRIVERGTHAELLQLGRRYASLYALQSLGGEQPDPGNHGRERVP